MSRSVVRGLMVQKRATVLPSESGRREERFPARIGSGNRGLSGRVAVAVPEGDDRRLRRADH